MQENLTMILTVNQRTRIEYRLEQLRYMKQDHNTLVLEYKHLFPSCVSKLSHLPSAKPDKYQPEIWAAKREQLMKAIKNSREIIDTEENVIYRMLSPLPIKHKKILIMHYLKGEPIKKIARELNVQPQYVNKLKRQAIVSVNRRA